MNEQTRNLEPWQWPEEHWRKIVDHVRAGKPYRPETWKDGGRCAVVCCTTVTSSASGR